MSYSRREVTDGVTVMNKDLYDNLQDGIDELLDRVETTEEGLAEIRQDLSLLSEKVEEEIEQIVTDLEEGLNDVAEKVNELEETSGDSALEAVGMKFDGEQDKLIVYNPFKQVWVDSGITTGKIILPSTITVTTIGLIGETVTCHIGEEIYTTTFISDENVTSGVAIFTVYSDGEATIVCNGYKTVVTVQTLGGGQYTTTLEPIIYLVQDGEIILPPTLQGSGTLTENYIVDGEEVLLFKAPYDSVNTLGWKFSVDTLKHRKIVVDAKRGNGFCLVAYQNETSVSNSRWIADSGGMATQSSYPSGYSEVANFSAVLDYNTCEELYVTNTGGYLLTVPYEDVTHILIRFRTTYNGYSHFRDIYLE